MMALAARKLHRSSEVMAKSWPLTLVFERLICLVKLSPISSSIIPHTTSDEKACVQDWIRKVGGLVNVGLDVAQVWQDTLVNTIDRDGNMQPINMINRHALTSRALQVQVKSRQRQVKADRQKKLGERKNSEDNSDRACLVSSIQCSKLSLRPSEFDCHLKHYRDDGFDIPAGLEEKGIFNLDDMRSVTYFNKSNPPPLNSHRKTVNPDLTVFSWLVDLALVFAPSREGNRSWKILIRLFLFRRSIRYKNDPEILAMTNLIAAYQQNEILEIGTISSSHEFIALWIPPL
ncbi:hypothetical protein L6452_40491 [Arctium lappa]|uniref:Uncharacterized protein n=1 Tax=Arctium lappa TaxID=4217 RepID=A0ACB8XLI6_ARCLA|nr:hypothetical protein L6452_40491 [Arctium lappa]